jgi:hypothetical protein
MRHYNEKCAVFLFILFAAVVCIGFLVLRSKSGDTYAAFGQLPWKNVAVNCKNFNLYLVYKITYSYLIVVHQYIMVAQYEDVIG